MAWRPASVDGALKKATSELEWSYNKQVKGNGVQLSWPLLGDSRRSILGKVPSDPPSGKRNRDPRVHDVLVNVSHQEVEMHYYMNSVVEERLQPVLEMPLTWNPSDLHIPDEDLFQHFVQSASKSLTILGHAPVALGNVLVRLALASTTSSATAVLKALLAFSALHRYGVVTQAVELKISAIKALSSASATHGGNIEAMQHVAAGMLLSSFEIHQASCTSGEWTWYLDGVRYVIQAADLGKLPYDRDLAVLLDWVYYNDVLARFSLRHYHPENLDKSARVLACDLPTSALHTTVFDVRITPSTAPSPMMPLVGLLSEVCDALSAPIKALATSEHADDHRNFVKVLEWKIRSTKLALLVYLNRASENLLKQGPKVKKYIDGAFSIIARMYACHRMFPLFVFGCEARSDEQRAAILDIASRSEKDVAARSFNHFRLLLQAIWAQDDLCEGELNYWDKLTRVISRCTIPPTFV
ncbi:hypothetical protein Cob_v009635 [Colletotrichum orbiculare MAFF 240422]|uniref:Zinc-finger transcription factor n=1 Tax=Colletotrichum orbiculare (strain 104-T / ATCC 96160 / CBS 514.97 / LARS 414 / MAFF 240422) TaxID=1213857 RepID=A0A484FHW9_COLOR|nr:hypothetical protein Cob_v009635 [Colletotrichum orbiculare MAFF 240422]